ncbi:benzoate/H(+) symporter BenE family transporter [Taklimakanibacter lacteus]|uniref:benzoate/H(+) symporter BenE family transporter n=1 Tax=Taklimakanibacter lacteus TaxID=2268456 RepID=UPI000E67513F
MSDVTQDAGGTSARGWFSLTSSALTAVVVGFASTILLIMEAADAVGANPAEKASWAASLCIGQAIITLVLSWRYKMPIIAAWSTPGAALIATSSSAGIDYPSAIGAFIAAGALTCMTALFKPVARLIERIPASIAAGMLAGVLLRYTMGVPGAAIDLPLLVLPLIVVFFALRVWQPLFAVPVVVAAGIALAMLTGSFGQSCCSLQVTEPVWTTPAFDWPVIVGLGLPLYLVTMASQNLPGFAVLKASGYQPPVTGSLWATGLGSILFAPFGSHQLNLAAITASIVTGPESHPDPQKRWLVAWPYLILYILVGLAAASFVAILGSLPKPLITAIAGLALFAPLLGSATQMFKTSHEVEAALATFLVSASGITLYGVGAPFWGLVAGLILYGARRLQAMR